MPSKVMEKRHRGEIHYFRCSLQSHSSAPLVLIKCLLNPSNSFNYCFPSLAVLQGLWQHSHSWWTSGDPQQSIAEEWHIVQKKRTKIGKRPIYPNCRPQDSEPFFSTNGNEEGRLKWYLEWTLPCRQQFLCIIIKSERELIDDPWNRIILKSHQG